MSVCVCVRVCVCVCVCVVDKLLIGSADVPSAGCVSFWHLFFRGS